MAIARMSKDHPSHPISRDCTVLPSTIYTRNDSPPPGSGLFSGSRDFDAVCHCSVGPLSGDPFAAGAAAVPLEPRRLSLLSGRLQLLLPSDSSALERACGGDCGDCQQRFSASTSLGRRPRSQSQPLTQHARPQPRSCPSLCCASHVFCSTIQSDCWLMYDGFLFSSLYSLSASLTRPILSFILAAEIRASGRPDRR